LALLEVALETLAGRGYEVIGVPSAEAIDELPEHFVADIAVLDLNLPGEDGLRLAQRLRQIQPSIDIIMVTARCALEQKLAAYGYGANVYLTKPIAPEELCATVKALAQRLKRSATPEIAGFNSTSGHWGLHGVLNTILRCTSPTTSRSTVICEVHRTQNERLEIV
jgi:DNA-binding response OmpR family regulator